ncbi:MAG: LCP family protein [Actinomycetota bacterium]|nr:LCP family protein [Actinomycetota bacterium]
MTRKRIIILAASAGVFLVVAFFGWQGARAWWAWNGIERVEFDIAEARERLIVPAAADSESAAEPEHDATPTPTYQAIAYDTILAIGSDARSEEVKQSLKDQGIDAQEDAFADAVLLWLVPRNGGDPILVSLPRDLLIVNPCTGEETKLDRTLAGCGDDISGPELVALTVEDYTGIGIDHFAMFEFDAFVEIIDALGGIEICVEHATRHGTMDLFPAGCSISDGTTALVWMRSRTTQEFIDGEWRFIEGVSDLDRVERQQTLMFGMLAKLKSMRSPADLAGLAGGLGDAIVLDESLSMGDAVAMAWDLRSVPSSRIRRIVVPTEPAVTEDGSFALRGLVPFRDLLEG